jgi:hypothetical protein
MWNALTVLATFALVIWAAGLRERLSALLLLAVALTLGHGVLIGTWLYLHVDAVCLLAATVGCVGLLRWTEGRGEAWLHAAVVALACATWTKQLAIMLYPALGCWLWREAGRSAVSRFVLWSTIHGVAVSMAVLAWFGAEEVLFNVVMTHLRNPQDGGWDHLAERVGEFIWLLLPWVPALVTLVWWRRRASAPLAPPVRSLLRQGAWCAAWLAPLGFKSAIMAGGGLNSVYSLQFGLYAILLLVGVQLAHPAPVPRGVIFAAALSGAVLVGSAYRHAAALQVQWRIDRGQEELVRLARAQPGRTYFPWNPLVTILTEKKVQPTDNALFLLYLMGLGPSPAAIRAVVPERPLIVYREPVQSRFALRYFPDVAKESAR